MKHTQHRQFMFLCLRFFLIICLLLTACDDRPKYYTVGVLNPSVYQEKTLEAFKEGMTELGYIEGNHITYIYEGVVTDLNILDAAAQRLVDANVNLIFSMTTPATLAAQRATAGTDIPIVFVPVTDPVGAGLVKSLKRPGGNITGITFSIQEEPRLQWLLQIAPAIKTIYSPYNPVDRSAILSLEIVSKAAAKLNVELITPSVNTPEEVAAAFENIPGEVDAIFFLPDTLVSKRIQDWIKTANEHKLPTSGPDPTGIEYGHLTAYGLDIAASAREQAARLADQILQGSKPADLPVEMAEFYSAINLQTAEAIGLDIPDAILFQADKIIR